MAVPTCWMVATAPTRGAVAEEPTLEARLDKLFEVDGLYRNVSDRMLTGGDADLQRLGWLGRMKTLPSPP